MAATQPPPGAQQGPPPQQMPVPPPMAPQTAALLDSLPFNPVSFKLLDPPARPPGAPPGIQILACQDHSQQVCKSCNVDFRAVNKIGVYMPMLAPGMVPPPPNVQYPKQAESIKDMRERGNAEFKASHFPQAIDLYTQSLNMSSSRPPWEATAIQKAELVSGLLNRSAAFAAINNWPAAYADADACTKLDKTNPKGFFRKARALANLSRLEEALTVVHLGITAAGGESAELSSYGEEIERLMALEKENEKE